MHARIPCHLAETPEVVREGSASQVMVPAVPCAEQALLSAGRQGLRDLEVAGPAREVHNHALERANA